MSEVVCEGNRKGSEAVSLEYLLKATAGTWIGTDGLTYQLSIRSEWKNRVPLS